MNAPISAALLQLRANAPAARVQPKIPATARLLCHGYEHDGLWVDLYGTLDAAGYEVEHVGVSSAQDKVDIGVTYKRDVLRHMSDWCDRMLPSARALGLISQQESRADLQMWMRNCGAEPP